MSQPHPNAMPTGPRLSIEERNEFDDLPWTGISVVVAVVGLLLFMAIPMNVGSPAERIAAQRERISYLALERFQAAVEDYRGDHGAWPGQDPQGAGTFGEPVYDAQALSRQLQMHSDLHGATLPSAEIGFGFGPYLPRGIPVNPENGLSSVRLLQEGESIDHIMDDIYGWVYDPRTGEVQKHVLPFQQPGARRKTRSHVRSNH